jgi:hypothetical protein
MQDERPETTDSSGLLRDDGERTVLRGSGFRKADHHKGA